MRIIDALRPADAHAQSLAEQVNRDAAIVPVDFVYQNDVGADPLNDLNHRVDLRRRLRRLAQPQLLRQLPRIAAAERGVERRDPHDALRWRRRFGG